VHDVYSGEARPSSDCIGELEPERA
jgi:hypothetical protein